MHLMPLPIGGRVPRDGRRGRLVTSLLAVVLLVACGSDTRKGLAAAPLPDLARLDASVQRQIRASHAALEQRRSDRGAADGDLGAAFGEYGMMLHAAEYLRRRGAGLPECREAPPR